jgi:Tfp pilus assembly protein PilF
MKILITTLLILASFFTFAQSSYQEWESKAEKNIRLLPKYGNVEKSIEHKEMDQKFIEETMKIEKFNGNKRLASNHMITLGFKYLYKGDLETAMYRFNQAFLLDPENPDIYWGFGAIYMSLSNYEKAKEQYEEGLKLNPNHTHLLTDYGTYFLAKYYTVENSQEKNAKAYLSKAIEILTSSYAIDAKDQNTLYKLSVCHLMNNDCKNARKYYDLCKEEGGEPITEEYSTELNNVCK